MILTSATPREAYMPNRLKYCVRCRPCSLTSFLSNDSTACNMWSLSVALGSTTWLPDIGNEHGPSCKLKCARKTRTLTKAVLTSDVGHSSRYSANLYGWLKSTLWANQLRTARLFRRCMHRASYHSLALPRRFFFVWNPVENRNLDASWMLIMASSSASALWSKNKHRF